MSQHLFLEGMIQIGKSTLLQELLEPYREKVGGFVCQRLTDSEGSTVAFRIGPAASTTLTKPYDESCDHIFRRIRENQQSENHLEIFETIGVQLLKHNEGKSLILLDEIGGIELVNDTFREALYDILLGDTPCLGVIKSLEKAKYMSSPGNLSIYEHNLLLRKFITEKKLGDIIHFEKNNDLVRQQAQDYIHKVFNS